MTLATGSTTTNRRLPLVELADWRRRVQDLYAEIRLLDPPDAHELWRRTRDELFRDHPHSPLPADDPMRRTGVPYLPYDPALRFELAVVPDTTALVRHVDTGHDGTTTMARVGHVQLPEPFDAPVSVWWLEQYGGGLFLPLRDATSGSITYGGGRYLLDAAKGADLGGDDKSLIVDLNFLYHPSCRYSNRWTCPLAPDENVVPVPVLGGERL